MFVVYGTWDSVKVGLTTDDAKILQHIAVYFCNSVSDCMLAPPFLQGTACNVANVSQFLVMRETFNAPVFALAVQLPCKIGFLFHANVTALL